MRYGLVTAAAVLCALPASGDDTLLSPGVINALTSIDAMPSKTAINQAFPSQQLALAALTTIALDHTIDLGIELRAINALPSFCPTATCTTGPGHDTAVALILDYATSPHTPQDLLRLRAAVEALGATRSGLTSDVDVLLPLLGHASRDVRATVVRALRNICNAKAVAPLKALTTTEPSTQVLLAIYAALQDLAQCGG